MQRFAFSHLTASDTFFVAGVFVLGALAGAVLFGRFRERLRRR